MFEIIIENSRFNVPIFVKIIFTLYVKETRINKLLFKVNKETFILNIF